MATIYIDVECSECGGDLSTSENGNIVKVEPCGGCAEDDRKKAREEPYDDGYSEGESQ